MVHFFLYGQNERIQDGGQEVWLIFQAQQLQHGKACFAIERRIVGVEVFPVRPPGTPAVEQQNQLVNTVTDGRLGVVSGRDFLRNHVRHHVINTGFVGFRFPGRDHAFEQNGFADLIQRLVRAGQYGQQAGDAFCRLFNVHHVRKGIKAQGGTVQVFPAGLFTEVFVARPHVDNPGEAVGVQHLPKDFLNKEAFARAGGPRYRNVVVGAATGFAEHIEKCQLVTVGRQRTAYR